MSKFDGPLKNIRVASPCSADWEQMYGDDRKRFCGDCKLNVYNLSGMSREEAEALIMNAEGRLCVRFYKRRDGSVITDDCPVGWARVKQRTRVIVTAAFSMIMAMLSGVFIVSLFSKAKTATMMGEMSVPITTSTPPHTMGAVSIQSNPKDNVNQVMGKMLIKPKPDRR
jgi:hypothetical protein